MNVETLLKNNWKWVVCYMFMYICIYGTLCMRFGLSVDDTKMVAEDTSYLAHGRWLLQIVREIFGMGPHQPVSCFVAGVFIVVAIMLQTAILGLHERWQKILYGIIYFSCLQWVFQLKYAIQCDVVALSLLAGSVSAYCLTLPVSLKNSILAVVCACLCLAGYQTAALYLCSIIVLMVMQRVVNHGTFPQIRAFAIHAFVIVSVGFVLYFITMKIGKCFAADWELQWVAQYQRRIAGWDLASSMTFKQFIVAYFHSAIDLPIRNILGKGYYGQWVYSTGLVALAAIFLKTALERRYITAFILGALGALCMYIPECSSALLPFGDASQLPRLKLAEPVVVAGIWGVLMCQLPASGKWMRFLCFCGLFLFVKASYVGAMMARDEAYYFNAALNEIRSMYTMASVEARISNMDSFEILVCGTPEKLTPDHLLNVNIRGYYINEPLPCCFLYKSRLAWYTRYARLPYMRVASEKEEAKHEQKLSAMPTWPKRGCIQVGDANQILLKIGPCDKVRH